MKTPVVCLLLALVLALAAGCSTVQSRITQHQSSFASWPPEVQQAVSAGQIGIGFTAEQVRVALGAPDYTYGRRAVDGSYDVWSYRDRAPRFSFGIGVGGGSYHRGGGYSTGVGVSTGGGYPGEKLRVVFDQTGRVTSIEQMRHGR